MNSLIIALALLGQTTEHKAKYDTIVSFEMDALPKFELDAKEISFEVEPLIDFETLEMPNGKTRYQFVPPHEHKSVEFKFDGFLINFERKYFKRLKVKKRFVFEGDNRPAPEPDEEFKKPDNTFDLVDPIKKAMNGQKREDVKALLEVSREFSKAVRSDRSVIHHTRDLGEAFKRLSTFTNAGRSTTAEFRKVVETAILEHIDNKPDEAKHVTPATREKAADLFLAIAYALSKVEAK